MLERVLPRTGAVLEVASGTGQHAVYFARALPELIWQPSEPNGRSLAALGSLVDACSLENVRPPLRLDAVDRTWPIAHADAVVCINMIHIAPWLATEGLLRGSREVLGAGAPLILYGPFQRHGRHTAPSNEAFDADLKARNPDWGIRDLEEVVAAAEEHGFALDEVVAMPANNLVAVLRRE